MALVRKFRKAIRLGLRDTARYVAVRWFARDGSVWRIGSRDLKFPVSVRGGTSDPLVFGQIFLTREYACFDDLRDVGLVVDLGANVGYSAAYFLSRFPSCFVIAVEPDAENFAALEANLSPYAGRYKALRAAVWSRNGRVHLDPATAGAHSAWGRRVIEHGDATTAVDAIDMWHVLALVNERRISVLKIDIEGTERDVFADDARAWLDRVDNICIELHGPACEAAVLRHLTPDAFVLSTSGELTIARRSSPRP